MPNLLNGLPDVQAILVNVGAVMNLVGGESGLITKAALLTGGFFLAQSCYRAYQAAMPNGGGQHGGFEKIVAPLFFGVLLLNFWQSQINLSDQLALSNSILAPKMPNAFTQQMWDALKVIMHGFGTVMVFRGLLLAKAAGDGSAGHQSPAWGAFWHVTGGVLLMRF